MQIEFNPAKFKSLVLFFAEKGKDDPCFGSTVLNKALFAAEFLAYRLHGRPIAGAKYVHRQFGPAPYQYLPIRDELVASGRLRIEDVVFMGKPQKRPVALMGPDLSSFNKEELEICEYVAKFFIGVKAMDAVNWSHTFPGYLLTTQDEEIPYHTAWLGNPNRPAITAADQQWAQQVIENLSASSNTQASRKSSTA